MYCAMIMEIPTSLDASRVERRVIFLSFLACNLFSLIEHGMFIPLNGFSFIVVPILLSKDERKRVDTSETNFEENSSPDPWKLALYLSLFLSFRLRDWQFLFVSGYPSVVAIFTNCTYCLIRKTHNKLQPHSSLIKRTLGNVALWFLPSSLVLIPVVGTIGCGFLL